MQKLPATGCLAVLCLLAPAPPIFAQDAHDRLIAREDEGVGVKAFYAGREFLYRLTKRLSAVPEFR